MSNRRKHPIEQLLGCGNDHAMIALSSGSLVFGGLRLTASSRLVGTQPMAGIGAPYRHRPYD
ncbi:MAG: hypothetical protein KIT60_16520 [Burkholderiaceae bacterium]|nr:hypothetical protein [Burkholderiaceae bacterium]